MADVYVDINGENYLVSFEEPNICPQCKYHIKPVLLNTVYYAGELGDEFTAFFFLCKACNKPFMSLYQISPYHSMRKVYDSTFKYSAPYQTREEKFSAHIENVSLDFCCIYNQALTAETHGLDEITGIGYRKALEFLLKDFLIAENPNDKDKIIAMNIGQCINTYIDNSQLKIAASRAVWLGNDQAHYVQKHTDKDVEDLKRLIKLTVNWIEMILLTREAESIEAIKS